VTRAPRIDEVEEQVRELFPDGWDVRAEPSTRTCADLEITSPTGEVIQVELQLLRDASPRGVAALGSPGVPTLAFADWVSPRARSILRSNGVSYLDSTGNAEIRLDAPTVFIRTTGADRNPDPKPTPGPQLRGPISELERGVLLPAFGEAVDGGELVGTADAAELVEHAAAADGLELAGVADEDQSPLLGLGEGDEGSRSPVPTMPLSSAMIVVPAGSR